MIFIIIIIISYSGVRDITLKNYCLFGMQVMQILIFVADEGNSERCLFFLLIPVVSPPAIDICNVPYAYSPSALQSFIFNQKTWTVSNNVSNCYCGSEYVVCFYKLLVFLFHVLATHFSEMGVIHNSNDVTRHVQIWMTAMWHKIAHLFGWNPPDLYSIKAILFLLFLFRKKKPFPPCSSTFMPVP